MPSRRSASAKSGSEATWRCTSFLKLRVRAISISLAPCRPFALPVVPPIGCGVLDVALLPLLRAADEQDHQLLTVAPEIDPVSRPKFDLVFEHAFADGLHPR